MKMEMKMPFVLGVVVGAGVATAVIVGWAIQPFLPPTPPKK